MVEYGVEDRLLRGTDAVEESALTFLLQHTCKGRDDPSVHYIVPNLYRYARTDKVKWVRDCRPCEDCQGAREESSTWGN
ncbi:hypothetical protein PsorP6_000405 [Peronosclerospora sorghi]|uniref:Uncharacterized protein n=1 Tax=Peronosclerospora sorghi TaxID=230839 RepID=A0ACC0WXL8_9STRA|nr:hypothetical protein PsorP6_000405 [Peronosclerospora sorghi]